VRGIAMCNSHEEFQLKLAVVDRFIIQIIVAVPSVIVVVLALFFLSGGKLG
jgi:hypothetical protein